MGDDMQIDERHEDDMGSEQAAEPAYAEEPGSLSHERKGLPVWAIVGITVGVTLMVLRFVLALAMVWQAFTGSNRRVTPFGRNGNPTSECPESETRTSPWDMGSEVDKPVIYLYPEDKTHVSVSLGHPERILVDYPAYGDGWEVMAAPDGTLTDEETGRSLYALYYEASIEHPDEMTDEGFVVGRDEIVPFLEEKLALLGLTEREAEEMIIYWLPRMRKSPYCYVRFSLADEEQAANSLDISPKPDHLIRIRMIWQGLDEPVDGIQEQDIVLVDRASLGGFVAVEWGGTELGD